MKRKIITLCGSTRFKKQFREVERMLTLQGWIVLPLAIFGKAEGIEHSKETEEKLFALQLDKINISDCVFIIDVGGYIGESTKKELAFAKEKGKFVKYYSAEMGVKNEY